MHYSDDKFQTMLAEARRQWKNEWMRSYYKENRDAVLARSKKWRDANPEKAKESRRKWERNNPEKVRKKANELRWKTSGMIDATIERYDELAQQQGGLCAICRNPDKRRRLAWDHNHQTGQPRGLLCTGCNVKLGWLESNKAAIESYFSKHA